jgi:Amt family ammonium transporter
MERRRMDAGVVQGWAALVMGVLAGSIPWYTMMILHKRSRFLKHVDDTLGVIHTHGVAGLLGGLLTGLLADPTLCNLFLPVANSRGAFYGGVVGGAQFGKQLAGALFVIAWNVAVTSVICVAINAVVPLRMPEEKLEVGDDAVHGEEAYALWGDGELYDNTRHGADEVELSGRAAVAPVSMTPPN